MVQQIQQRQGNRESSILQRGEYAFQRLAQRFDGDEFYRPCGALEAVRLAKYRLDNARRFGTRRDFFQRDQARRHRFEVLVRLNPEGREKAFQ